MHCSATATSSKTANTDPRKRTAAHKTGPSGCLNLAGSSSEIIDNARGQKSKGSFILDKKGYTAAEVEELKDAIAEANQVEENYEHERDGAYDSPYAKRRRTEWKDLRNAVIANVHGGIGPVFLMQRGDFNVCYNLLKHKNKYDVPRFAYTLAGKKIMDEANWPASNKFWLYQYACSDYAKLVARMQAHSELQDWKVTDLGHKSMDFVATDRAIYDHLTRLTEAKKINPETTNPAHFFAEERKIMNVASWMSAMDAKFDNETEW